MRFYLIYVGISHINQLTKLYPDTIQEVCRDINEIACQFGGQSVGRNLYGFPFSLNEIARKTAEAAEAMHSTLMRRTKKLYGTTVLIGWTDDEAITPSDSIDSLKLRVPDENRIWLAPMLRHAFEKYLRLSEFDGILRIDSFKDAGLRLEERLPKLLIRSNRFGAVRKVLETLEKKNCDSKVLLLRGVSGSGKRATLNAVLETLDTKDSGAPIVIPFTSKSESPMEPFIRALSGMEFAVEDYLDLRDASWWASEGDRLVKCLKKGMHWRNIPDQLPTDIIHTFRLYIKAFIEKQRQCGKPAYLLVDTFNPDSEAVPFLRTVLLECLDTEGFRLIIIRDSDNFSEIYPLPGKGHVVGFRNPSPTELARIIKNASTDGGPKGRELEHITNQYGGNLYRLFHLLLVRESGMELTSDPTETLISSLDITTRKTLFLAYAATGIATRSLIAQRFPESEEHVREAGCYDGLIALGLIFEESDGRVRKLPDVSMDIFVKDSDYRNEAECFGEYLYKRYETGSPLDVFRLFRYLEEWGPSHRAIMVLKKLLECLLTQRQLRVAGNLLNSTPLSSSNLEGKELKFHKSIMIAAKMHYQILTGDTQKVATGKQLGNHSGHSALHNARISYALGHRKDSVSATKKALFSFQRSGNHKGETHAHIELALGLLASGNMRDALEHFSIAHRIASQINVTWGILRAATLGSVTQFLLGNLSKSARECKKNREMAHREGRRDIWLLLTLTELRISWDLGRFREAVALAEEGSQIAKFYSLADEQRVMAIWKGRSLLAQGEDEGRVILESFHPNREALAFLAEYTWLNGDTDEAKRLIRLAARKKRQSVRMQVETDDWSDGYFPIEGRLADSSGPLDVLGERIRGLNAFFTAHTGNKHALPLLNSLLERDGRRIPRPFSYQYALWATLILPHDDKDTQTRYMTRAFNDLQTRAGRFDDNQTKLAWLTANHWNRVLMDEAQKREFL